MASKHGFDELSDELDRLAQRFEQSARKKASDPSVRAVDEKGQFITFREAIMNGISDALRQSAIQQAQSEARKYLPSNSNRRSGLPQIRQDPAGWQGDRYKHYFYSTNDLVRYHEFGTGQHGNRGTTEAVGSAGPGYIIEPRNEDVLSFRWDKLGGARVAFEYVVHPGVRGKHFMRRALSESTDDMRRNIADSIRNMEWDEL